jgi:ribosomal protein L7/L12
MSLPLIVIAILVIFVVFWVVRRLMPLFETSANLNSAKSRRTNIEREKAPHQEYAIPNNLQAEINTLVVQNKKIAAIKRVRKHTGWGLKQAKDYVDSLSVRNSDENTIASLRNITPELDHKLKKLVLQNHKIGAIRLLRKQSGMDLKESKDYIDRLENLN